MEPLIVLVVAFAVVLIITRIFSSQFKVAFSARIAMSVMLVFTAVAHFAFTEGMAMMIPSFIPFKIGLIYFTGIIEILLAVGLLIPATRLIAGWCLIALFILLLPANIYAAIYNINYQEGSYDGKGLNYLWFRVPLQILFIVWVYFSTIKFTSLPKQNN